MSVEDAWLDPLKTKFAARLMDEGEAFRAMAADPDCEAIAQRAHKLAGIAGMLGAPAVGEAALRVEEAALSGADCELELEALLAAIADATG